MAYIRIWPYKQMNMKKLLFLIAFAPLAAFGQNFNYAKIISVEKGADNFHMDIAREEQTNGAIEINKQTIKIDNTVYDLQTVAEDPNMFKSKKCSVKFIYKADMLAMVELIRSNRIVCYVIQKDDKAQLVSKN